MRIFFKVFLFCFLYILFAASLFYQLMGYKTTVSILKASPFESINFSATTLIASAILASITIGVLYGHHLKKRLVFYLFYGFHTGTLAVFLYIIIDGLLSWAHLSDFLLAPIALLIMGLVGLVFSFLFGYVLISLIPALLAAYLLWFINTVVNRLYDKK